MTERLEELKREATEELARAREEAAQRAEAFTQGPREVAGVTIPEPTVLTIAEMQRLKLDTGGDIYSLVRLLALVRLTGGEGAREYLEAPLSQREEMLKEETKRLEGVLLLAPSSALGELAEAVKRIFSLPGPHKEKF